MNTNNHTIDLNITLTSPLYLAYPDNQEKVGDSTISRTVKKPVFVSSDKADVPYVPANGFRGGLRRAAAARVMAKLKTEGAVPTPLYLGLTCGASTGTPDSTPLSVEELLRARRNVYMGVFGGGARLLQSAYRASDLNPVLKFTLDAGVVPENCGELVKPRRSSDAETSTYVEPWALTKGILNMIRVDDVARVMRPGEILEYLESPQESVAAHQEFIMGNNVARKEGTASKESVANMMTFETVATGTHMHLRLTLSSDVTESQVGLMLYALNDMIRENSLGGMGRIGFGQYRVDKLKLQLGDALGGGHYAGIDMGPADQFSLPNEQVIQRLLEAADQGLTELTIAKMQSYFTDFSAAAKAEKKAAKKSKKDEEKAEA